MSRLTDHLETKASANLPGPKPAKPKPPRENPTERLDPSVIGRLVREAVTRRSQLPTEVEKPAQRKAAHRRKP